MTPEIMEALRGSATLVIILSPGYTASEDNTTRLWDTTTGKEVQRLSHNRDVRSVAFNPDGRHIATASEDNTARLWDADTGTELHRLSHDSDVLFVTYSPDGKHIATASQDTTARLWLWQPDDMIDQLCERLLHNLSWNDWQKYFENEPYRKTCPDLPVDPHLKKRAKQLFDEGNTDDAIRRLKELNAAEPSLKLNPEQEIRRWKASKRLSEAEKLLKDGKIEQSVAAFKKVERLDASAISAKLWNRLCWTGALANLAPQVLFACEKAVSTAKGDDLWHYRDSRGLARALTGDTQGAIEDFESYIASTANEKRIKQRQNWIAALRAGQNPFNEKVLESLRGQ